jgi:RNA-directed DNA polymerase
VKRRLYGKAFMIGFADDAVLVFERLDDAERVMAVLPKRFERYGLALHPEKTRMLCFKRPGYAGAEGGDSGTFNFLGFTHFWAKSRRGYWVIKRKTAKDRFKRSVKRRSQWLRGVRPRPIAEQHQVLCSKVRGHLHYYGITGNSEATSRFVYCVRCCWRKWLGRRSHQASRNWDWFNALSQRFPLPVPKTIHSC